MAGFEDSAGLGVSNHYGPRESGQTSGKVKTEGVKNEYSIQFDAADIGVALFSAPALPADSLVTAVYLKVSEAFALGGTTPTILVGTDTSEVTNGAVLDEASAEAVGVYDITASLTGTWAANLVAETDIGIVLGGTTPTVGAAGKAEVIIEYLKVAV
jgi:hypothetical protein